MSEFTYFLHSGSIGDVHASIPAMREYHRSHGKKIILFLEKDLRTTYYEGATHPTRNAEGDMCLLNEQVINMMIPLYKAQSFIEDCRIWNGEPVHIDLNDIRRQYVGIPNFSIQRWYFYIYPDLACDLSRVWIDVPDAEKDLAKGKIILTRTERYRNPFANYSFLKDFEDQIVFCGTNKEYNLFNMDFDLKVGRLVINDFLELAQALKQCKFHISNQTQAFQLSEGQKIPRILETCQTAPNVHPIGEHAYDFFAQKGLEYYFHKLIGKGEEYVFENMKQENPALAAG